MLSQFVFALKMRIKTKLFPLGPHDMFRSGGAGAVCFSFSLSFLSLSLSFSFNEESGFVAGSWRRRRSTGRERGWQEGRGQTRWRASTGSSGRTLVECNQGAHCAKGHDVLQHRKSDLIFVEGGHRGKGAHEQAEKGKGRRGTRTSKRRMQKGSRRTFGTPELRARSRVLHAEERRKACHRST